MVEALEDKRIKPVPRDPMLPVHTVWDLGWNDQTSIIFVQRVGSECRIVDYIEDSHRSLDEYVADVESRKWKWGIDYLPHDGAAKNLQTGLSPQDVLNRLGRSVVIVPNVPVEQGIKAARMAFRQCFFDETKAARLVECLKRYRRNIPTTTEEPATPVHDEYSHGADAFRYMALSLPRMHNDDWGDKPIQYDNRGIV